MISFDDPDPRKAAANRKNHEGVTFEEAKTVFDDAANLTMSDFESDPEEDRFVMVGMSVRARVLVVVYTYRGEKVRIISARKATANEQKEYSEQ